MILTIEDYNNKNRRRKNKERIKEWAWKSQEPVDLHRVNWLTIPLVSLHLSRMNDVLSLLFYISIFRCCCCCCCSDALLWAAIIKSAQHFFHLYVYVHCAVIISSWLEICCIPWKMPTFIVYSCSFFVFFLRYEKKCH